MTISCTSPRCVAYNHFDKSKPSKNRKVALTSQSSRGRQRASVHLPPFPGRSLEL